MTIQEKGLPNIGGQWCGSAWGYTVYYSESASLNLTLLLTKLSDQVIENTVYVRTLFIFILKGENQDLCCLLPWFKIFFRIESEVGI